jgi:hypothetical protein
LNRNPAIHVFKFGYLSNSAFRFRKMLTLVQNGNIFRSF